MPKFPFTGGAFIPFEFITHRRRVQSIYKKIIRDIESWNKDRHNARIQSVLMRHEFDKNKDIKDPVKAKMLVKEAEETYQYIKSPMPRTFTTSADGVAFDRKESIWVNDQLLDHWHPLEKAQYPDYFARREQRKKEFVEWYDKTYGRPKYEKFD